tara:strand:- start:40543 stop:41211 length:669 start_codon:yes stop_codon:yes gene_type:complete
MSTQKKHLEVFNTEGKKRQDGSMTAREILVYVKEKTGKGLEIDLKSKKQITTKALEALTAYDEHQAVYLGKTDQDTPICEVADKDLAIHDDSMPSGDTCCSGDGDVCCDPNVRRVNPDAVKEMTEEAEKLGLTLEQYEEHIEEILEPALYADQHKDPLNIVEQPLNILDLTEFSRWDMAAHYRAATGKGIRVTKLGVLFSSREELARDLAIGLNSGFDDFIC